ncbi:hypothetical protein Gotri_020617, partial [Gossypium trilobum]|nr:hypothetical protein [Gossypium trilobum]
MKITVGILELILARRSLKIQTYIRVVRGNFWRIRLWIHVRRVKKRLDKSLEFSDHHWQAGATVRRRFLGFLAVVYELLQNKENL